MHVNPAWKKSTVLFVCTLLSPKRTSPEVLLPVWQVHYVLIGSSCWQIIRCFMMSRCCSPVCCSDVPSKSPQVCLSFPRFRLSVSDDERVMTQIETDGSDNDLTSFMGFLKKSWEMSFSIQELSNWLNCFDEILAQLFLTLAFHRHV